MLSKKEIRRRTRAYERGRTDAESALMIDMTFKGWATWRMKAGLPAKAVPSRPRKLQPELVSPP